MVTKHFFKTLITFMVMIIVGLIGVFLVSFFDNRDMSGDSAGSTDNTSSVINATTVSQ